MTSKKWFLTALAGTLSLLLVCAGITGYTDPFFHYHYPLTDRFFYPLNNERSQNDGIARQFEFDSVITGTSLTENFKTSEAEELFGGKFVKLSMSGGSYKEVNDQLKRVFTHQPALKTVIRSLDMNYFFKAADYINTDLGEQPSYLFNNNPLDDVHYLLNKDILIGRSYKMIKGALAGEEPGITSFDDYANWMSFYTFGRENVLQGRKKFKEPEKTFHITEEEKAMLKKSLEENVLLICEEHPDTVFYCYIPPYSAAWWGRKKSAGELEKQFEAEEYVIRLLVNCENLKLYSFNNFSEITFDLDNYKDYTHHGEWINSLLLKYMKEEKGLLTKDNYTEYLEQERELYGKFQYDSLL